LLADYFPAAKGGRVCDYSEIGGKNVLHRSGVATVTPEPVFEQLRVYLVKKLNTK
jgi:hypothetical protein